MLVDSIASAGLRWSEDGALSNAKAREQGDFACPPGKVKRLAIAAPLIEGHDARDGSAHPISTVNRPAKLLATTRHMKEQVKAVALQDAASIAGLLITTEAMVAEIPKKEAAPVMPGGGGMGGMGGMDF